MRDGWQPDNGAGLCPGQIWLTEQRAAGGLSALDGGALSGADIVLYDRSLASTVAGALPAGSYAEPLAAGVESDAPAIMARALKLACEGWSVVQLIHPRRGRRRRLRLAAEELGRLSWAGYIPVRLIVKTAQPPCSREVHLQELRALVDGSAKDELMTLIVGPLAAPPYAAAYAFAANGLAG